MNIDEIIPFHTLIKEVGLWSAYNFGQKQNPWLGMVEEIGELAHCLLKRHQQIRGYDDPVFFLEEFKDALGDIGVYAANYAYNEGMRKVKYPENIKPDLTMSKHIGNSLHWLSDLMLVGEDKEDYLVWFSNFLKEISYIAKLEGLEFAEVVTETWLKVKMRNWKENAHDGESAISGTYEENVMVDEEKQREES